MFNNTDKQHREAKGYTCEKRLLLQVKKPRLRIDGIHLWLDELDNGKLNVRY